jgi:hypothetical protein
MRLEGNVRRGHRNGSGRELGVFIKVAFMLVRVDHQELTVCEVPYFEDEAS